MWIDPHGANPKIWRIRQPLSHCPSHITHGLVRDVVVRGLWRSAWPVARPPKPGQCESILIWYNKMQQYAGIYLLQNYSLRVSGVHRTHHQENIKL